MGLRPTYMDESHLEWMSFDGVGGDSGSNRELAATDSGKLRAHSTGAAKMAYHPNQVDAKIPSRWFSG